MMEASKRAGKEGDDGRRDSESEGKNNIKLEIKEQRTKKGKWKERNKRRKKEIGSENSRKTGRQ